MSLAQAGAAFSGSAKAAAIAVGTLDTPAKEFVRPFPKQVDRKPCSGAHCVGAPRRIASPVRRAVTAIGSLQRGCGSADRVHNPCEDEDGHAKAGHRDQPLLHSRSSWW